LGPNKVQNKEKFDKTGWKALVFGMDDPLGEDMQTRSNGVPRVMYGPAPGT